MKGTKKYAFVILKKEGEDVQHTFFGEVKDYKTARMKAIKKSAEGILAGVDCYRETQMTTYEEIWLEVYMNEKKIGRITY